MFINYRNNDSREIVIGYKSIYINVYTIVVLDITSADSEQTIIFSHEAFQLWESAISGLFLQTKEFVTLNKDGMNVVSLSSNHRRALRDNLGNDRMVHSLESMSCLKIDHENMIKYSCQKFEKREITIQ